MGPHLRCCTGPQNCQPSDSSMPWHMKHGSSPYTFYWPTELPATMHWHMKYGSSSYTLHWPQQCQLSCTDTWSIAPHLTRCIGPQNCQLSGFSVHWHMKYVSFTLHCALTLRTARIASYHTSLCTDIWSMWVQLLHHWDYSIILTSYIWHFILLTHQLWLCMPGQV